MSNKGAKIIGSQIKQLRLDQNMKQVQLASLLGVDRQYVWRLENGRVNIAANYLDKIIDCLGCDHADFLQIPPDSDL